MHILLIEDDPMIGCSLTRALEDAQLSVVWIRDGINGELAAVQGEYSLILLDLGLPEQSGLSILTNLRNKGNRTPLLIITARDEIDDRVAGLEAGADDYLIKPFGFKELMARIHAVMRRTSEQTAAELGNGEISLVISTHEASYRGKTLLLPAREFALLYTLVDKPGSIFSREQIEASAS